MPWVTLADFGDTEGFNDDGEEDQLYAFQLADGMYRRKKLPQEENGPLKFEKFSNVDVSHATPNGFIRLCLMGKSGFRLRTPSNKQDRLLT